MTLKGVGIESIPCTLHDASMIRVWILLRGSSEEYSDSRVQFLQERLKAGFVGNREVSPVDALAHISSPNVRGVPTRLNSGGLAFRKKLLPPALKLNKAAGEGWNHRLVRHYPVPGATEHGSARGYRPRQRQSLQERRSASYCPPQARISWQRP